MEKKEIKNLLTGAIILGVLSAVFYFYSPKIPEKIVTIKNTLSGAKSSGSMATSTSDLKEKKPPQFVLLSFDGSRSIDMWEKTRYFAKEMENSGVSVKFTYFISGVYFLTENNKNVYKPPRKPEGSSLIGFARTDDLASRVGQVNLAEQDGHEIASHGNGHFLGNKWSYEDWESELRQFRDMVSHIGRNNPETLNKVEIFGPEKIRGFRAPELGVNEDLYKALADTGFRYDASGMSFENVWPKKDQNGLWRFPITTIRLGNLNFWTLAIDYSIFMNQTGAKDYVKKETPLWDKFYNQVLESYNNYFKNEYDGNRAPVHIAGHFSLWNDSVYWEAVKEFIRQTCGKSEVKCVTYSELADYLDGLTPAQLDNYQRGVFE